jgi:hypothetical protein
VKPNVAGKSNIPVIIPFKENIPPPDAETLVISANEPPIKKTIKAPVSKAGPVKQTKKNVGSIDAANAKLISALESEERRLRDNELRYAERVKSLSSQLEIERGGFIRAQELARQMEQNTRKLVSLSEKLKNAESANLNLTSQVLELNKDKNELEQKLAISVASVKELGEKAQISSGTQKELFTAKSELDNVIISKKQLEKSLSESKNLNLALEMDKNKLAARLIKEREQAKIKLAEVILINPFNLSL